MKDAKGHGSDSRGAHAEGVSQIGQPKAGVHPDKINAFVSGAQGIVNQYYQKNFGDAPHMMANIPKLEVRNPDAPRYVAVDRVERSPSGEVTGRSVHAFIDRNSGDVLKPDGYKRPAKGSRGNLNDERGGLGRMGPHGPGYNK